ncbi:hypothetical protein BP5796_03639 [Coleophoma crateriformis]|uniref:Zn(2)-C6 fungal-type domain-containing protein n=1 Tax=Coleophoma crateriformis TaxID=565419 RepID=A0A3D8SNP4_9HELO|nr:hypothetical protein BP5796_03639 [Coleophoma crateriformis]
MPVQDQNARVRRRIGLACNGCRIKRTKCDGHHLQCSACKYREEQCEYTEAESKRKLRRPSKEYIAALEARVACLEERLATFTSDTRVPSTRSDSISESESLSRKSSNVDASNKSAQAIDKASVLMPIDELADVFGSFTIGDAGELRFYGASSNLNLNRNQDFRVTSSVGARMQGIKAAQALPGLQHHKGLWEISDDLRDHLLEIYWQWQNSWQYLVPRESFIKDLYTEKTSRFCTPLLLTAILAHASRYSDRIETRIDPHDPNTAGGMLYTQAKTMLHYEMEAPTTSTVQAAGLLALYGAAIDSEALGWVYAGMASRMAFSLGLHSDFTEYVPQGVVSAEDADARNVAWWGVLFGLGYGRPACIQEYNVTAAKPLTSVDNEPLTLAPEIQDSHSPAISISHMSVNAIYTCELFQITSEVLDQLYARQSGWTTTERDDYIMETHLKLVAFHDRLPKILKISPSCLQPAMPHVYQLHLQYHVQMILLHRPFFRGIATENSNEETSGDDDVHTRSCRLSAEKISNIFRNYSLNYGLRRIPISAVHPAYTAAVIHMADIKNAKDITRSKTMKQLQVLVKSLYDMNIAWSWSNRSIRAMETLAKEWNIDLWTGNLKKEVSQESFDSFQRYMAGDVYKRQDNLAIPPPPSVWPDIVNDNFLNLNWQFDPNFELGTDITDPKPVAWQD